MQKKLPDLVLICSDYFMMGYVGSRVYVQSSLYLYEKEYPWKIESEEKEYLYMTSTTCDLIFVNKIMIKKTIIIY